MPKKKKSKGEVKKQAQMMIMKGMKMGDKDMVKRGRAMMKKMGMKV